MSPLRRLQHKFGIIKEIEPEQIGFLLQLGDSHSLIRGPSVDVDAAPFPFDQFFARSVQFLEKLLLAQKFSLKFLALLVVLLGDELQVLRALPQPLAISSGIVSALPLEPLALRQRFSQIRRPPRTATKGSR